MAFPGRRTGALQPSSPILVTANSSVPVPSNARIMHAFIVGGGGSGGAGVNSGGTQSGGAGGGCGGSLYVRVDLRLWQGELPQRASRADTVGLTIGSGGTAIVQTANGGTPGNTGNTTTLTLTGGLSIAVTGGTGGEGGTGSPRLGGSPGGSATSYVVSRIAPTDAVIVRPMVAVPMGETADAHTTNSTGATGGNASPLLNGESVSTPGAIASTVLLPWWIQSVGINFRGTAGTGAIVANAGRAAAGGAGGFAGNGGNGVASNTAAATGTAGAGYGSGGGGAATIAGQTATSGAGAPGCAVLMFEVEV